MTSVVPIYIHGLCLTGSSHSSTLICDASYACDMKKYSINALSVYSLIAKIKKGVFRIKSYKDFIGLMFAIYIYNLDVKDIKQFL